MLEQLIHSVKIGLISYLRQIEELHYRGPLDIQPHFPDSFSHYVKNTVYLSAARKSHLLAILQLCQTGNTHQPTPKEFTTQLLAIIAPLRSAFERWRGKFSRLQLAMVHAIEQYSLHLVKLDQAGFNINITAADDPVDPFQLTHIVPLSTDNSSKQLQEMTQMIAKFQQQLENQSAHLDRLSTALAEERAKQAIFLAENHQLARTVCELQATLLEQKALTMETGETIEETRLLATGGLKEITHRTPFSPVLFPVLPMSSRT